VDEVKILITGATGFLGNCVVTEMLKYNHQIITTSRNSNKARNCPWFNQVSYIQSDLNEKGRDFFQVFEKPDCLIHLAWEGLPNYQNIFHIERNLFSNYFFLKNMLSSGLKNLTVIGTCYEYGFQNGCLSEKAETRPITAYGLAKDTLCKFINQFQKEYTFNYKWLRLFYIYGSGMNQDSIFSRLDQAIANHEPYFNMTGGEQLRDYLPVETVAAYIVRLALSDQAKGIINCCSGTPISVRKMVENYVRAKNESIQLNFGYVPYRDFEPMAFWGNPEKLNETLSKN
jgi:nucleoside-diphosphate-sugar epimerase